MRGDGRRARVGWFAVAAIVAAGVAMSALWAAMLPPFLAPDEDNHYDYALTLYEARRPLRASETVLGRDTNPVIAYLMDATHVRQQRLDSAVRADPGYRTAAYRAAIEARAPHVDRAALARGPIEPAPYIARLYPIGYYAALALAIAAGDVFTAGSAFGEFFFARGLSVVLLVPALVFAWLCFRELRIPAPRALAMLACVALFPMNASTFGSVQPDCLATALVAAGTYVALRLRRFPTSAPATIALGTVFAALIATKQHYFAAAFLPIAALLAVRLPWRTAPAAALRVAATVTVPAVLALAYTKQLLATAVPATGICQVPAGRAAATHAGLAALAHFYAKGFWSAFEGTYLFSTGRDSFWVSYGAYRNALIALPTVDATSAISTVLFGLAAAVALLFVVRLFRNVRRLARVGRERSWRSAARVATANAYVNGYLALYAVLFAYETYIGGAFPMQGRYWLPFLPAVWIVATALAPRALPRKYAEPLGNVLLGGLVAFCLVAAVWTYPTLQGRFAGPPASLDPGSELFANVTAEPDGAVLDVRGVAIDMRDASPAASVLLSVDGGAPVAAAPEARPDVECEMESSLRMAGYAARLPLTGLAPGPHRVRLFMTTPWHPEPFDTTVEATFVTAAR